MPEFLVELYVSRSEDVAADRARRAARELSRQGTPVRYLRSIFVPEDKTCFFLYEAARLEDVEEAARRASLPFDRVSKTIAEPDGEQR